MASGSSTDLGLAHVPAAVVAVDLDSCVTLWNAAAADLYGWTAEQAVGRSVHDLFLQGQQRTDVRAATHLGEVWEGEMPVIHRDGHAFTVVVRNAPLCDETGAVVGVVGVSMDADALRAAEDGRAATVAELSAQAGRAAKRTERLQRLTAALVPARTVHDIATTVVETGLEAVDAISGGVSLLDRAREELVLSASKGLRPELLAAYARLPMAHPTPVTDAVRSGQPLIFGDAASWHAVYPGIELATDAARAAIPISSSTGAAMGALSLTFAERRAFDDLDVELLVTIGRLCGQAIERAQLLMAEREMSWRNAFIARASDMLAQTLDVEQTLASLVHLLVPDLADWVVVHLREAERVVARAAAHADPEAAQALELSSLGNVLDLTQPGGASEAVRTARSVHYAEVPEVVRERIRAPEGVPPHIAERLVPRTGMAIPMVVAGRVVGAMSLAREHGPRYEDRDVAIVEELASRAAVALTHARDYERQRDSALTLQRSLLPRSLPALPGLTFDWRYLPGAEGALVGGDWYDVLPLDHGRVAVVIGDVMGSGVTGAAVMGQLRAMARAYTEAGMRPGDLLRHLDAALPRLEQEAITTLLYAIVDPATCVVTIASAGHLPPLVCLPDGEPHFLDLDPGPPLGAGPGDYRETRVVLPAGATLLLFTDGLVEDRNTPLADGMERLRAAVEVAESCVPGEVCDAALAAAAHATMLADDVALLAVGLSPHDSDPFTSCMLTTTAELPALRAQVREHMAGWDLRGEVTDDVLLVLSELVTNALLHVGGEVTATVRLEPGLVRVEAHDHAADALPLSSLEAVTRSQGRLVDDELDAIIDALTEAGTTGRGMALVEALCRRWGVEVEPTGKAVWAEVALAGAPVDVPLDELPPGAIVARLVGVPVRLILASGASLDEMLREVLMTPEADLAALVGVDSVTAVLSTSRRREPFRVMAREALARGQRLVDVQTVVTPQTPASMAVFERVMDELVALSEGGRLLLSRPEPEVQEFRAWWMAEIVAQLDGRAPVACPFPALPPG